MDELFEAHEEFIALEMTDRIDSLMLVNKRCPDLSVNKLRGQCYDGAATIAGTKAGVAQKLLDEEPRAIYTHCYGHALNLACGDTIRNSKLMRSVLHHVEQVRSPTLIVD